MSQYRTTIRLPGEDKRRFGNAAKRRGWSLARFLIEAGRKEAAQTQARFACLDYPDEVELSEAAEKSPREFIRCKLHARHR